MSDPREVLRRLREAAYTVNGISSHELLLLLDVAEAALLSSEFLDLPPWNHTKHCTHIRAALERLGEK